MALGSSGFDETLLEEEEQFCLQEFIDNVNQRMTVGCALPFSIPENEIKRIIKQSLEYFYNHYEDFTQEEYLLLPYEELIKPEFRKGVENYTNGSRGKKKLPENVFSVIAVYEMGGYNGEGDTRWLGYNMYTARQILRNNIFACPAIAADNLSYYVITESFLDITRQMYNTTISHNYNRLNHTLSFLGHLPKSDIVIETLTKLDLCSCLNDELFFRYVVAQTKAELNDIITRWNFTLPGNVTLNLQNDGTSEISEIKQEIKEMQGNWYFLTT